METQKHSEAANFILENQPTISSFFKTDPSKEIEIKLSLFLIEHNVAFATMDHLSKLVKNCFTDSDYAKNISIGRTKSTAIVKNAVGKTQLETICEIMNTNAFSLCIDESTDISNKKLMCLVSRVCLDFKIYDFFFGLIEVDKCDAVSLFTAIKKYFLDNKIDYQKQMIGFAADGAPNMTGKYNSVASHFKKEIPNLFILKCVCHSLALCSSYACLKLPSSVETLTRNIYNYISNSPKRNNQFQQIQSLLEFKPKKLLHPSQTRWLSLESVVNRLLELFEPLKIYFGFAVNIDLIDTAKDILNNLNGIHQLYFYFLKYILRLINNVNKLFQSESVQIQNVYSELSRLLKTVLTNFVKEEYVDNFEIQSFNNEDIFLSKDEVYLGIDVKENQSSLNIEYSQYNIFVECCVQFYIELVSQILKRFDFSDKLLEGLNAIEPTVALNKKNDSILQLAKLFPNLLNGKEYQELDNEVRELRNMKFSELETLAFWKNVSNLKRANNARAFPILTQFVSSLMALPHSSANVERIFNIVNLNKTKTRNALDSSTLQGILFSKDYLKLNNSQCFNIAIKNDLLKKFHTEMYQNKVI